MASRGRLKSRPRDWVRSASAVARLTRGENELVRAVRDELSMKKSLIPRVDDIQEFDSD